MNQTLVYATYITHTNSVANKRNHPQTRKSKPEVEKFDENWMVSFVCNRIGLCNICCIYQSLIHHINHYSIISCTTNWYTYYTDAVPSRDGVGF